MKITILHNQSILDIAIQHTGTVENCFDIAVFNGFNISEFLAAGTIIEIPDDMQKNDDILNRYKAKQIQPASATTAEQNSEIPALKGIGNMRINNTFKVS